MFFLAFKNYYYWSVLLSFTIVKNRDRRPWEIHMRLKKKKTTTAQQQTRRYKSGVWDQIKPDVYWISNTDLNLLSWSLEISHEGLRSTQLEHHVMHLVCNVAWGPVWLRQGRGRGVSKIKIGQWKPLSEPKAQLWSRQIKREVQEVHLFRLTHWPFVY